MSHLLAYARRKYHCPGPGCCPEDCEHPNRKPFQEFPPALNEDDDTSDEYEEEYKRENEDVDISGMQTKPPFSTG